MIEHLHGAGSCPPQWSSDQALMGGDSALTLGAFVSCANGAVSSDGNWAKDLVHGSVLDCLTNETKDSASTITSQAASRSTASPAQSRSNVSSPQSGATVSSAVSASTASSMVGSGSREAPPIVTPPVIQARDLSFGYAGPNDPNPVIRRASFSVGRGESLALMGVSGTGKSTLLHVLGLLDTPTSGDVIINGVATSACRDDEKTMMRRCAIGFVYQFHHLLHDLTSVENIMMPRLIAGQSRAKAHQEAMELLKAVHLQDHSHHFPCELSGGQKQRVAIARALANTPDLILADEPTGNLDEYHAQEVFDLLLSLVSSRKMSLIVVTHHLGLAQQCDHIRWLSNGVLHKEPPE